jgi:cadmium resistance protein CadD (predicted permease)
VAILEVIALGIGAFVATNIDDLFILMVFFAKRSFTTPQIILGQYVGMALIAFVIPVMTHARCVSYEFTVLD